MKYFFKLFLLLTIVASSLFALKQNKILTPEEAFLITAKRSGDLILVDIKLGENIYIYDDKLKTSLISPLKQSLDKNIKRPNPITYHEHLIHIKNIVN